MVRLKCPNCSMFHVIYNTTEKVVCETCGCVSIVFCCTSSSDCETEYYLSPIFFSYFPYKLFMSSIWEKELLLVKKAKTPTEFIRLLKNE